LPLTRAKPKAINRVRYFIVIIPMFFVPHDFALDLVKRLDPLKRK
jgi:hypothetical protein